MSTVLTKVYGWWADDRATLLAAQRAVRFGASGAFLEISLPCGHLRRWENEGDVPAHSVECRCGELPYEHWFIKYGKEEA